MEPEALANRPDLPTYLGEHYRAFKRLTTRRPPAAFGGICPIPLSEILAYITIFGTDDESLFVDVVCTADAMLVRRIAEKEKAMADAKSKPKTS